MSFKCEKCNQVSGLYEKQYKKVVSKREKNYHYYIIKVRTQRGKSEQIYTEQKPDEKDRNKQIVKEFNTKGWEIIKELRLCKRCFNA